jgi:hypothetical protein
MDGPGPESPPHSLDGRAPAAHLRISSIQRGAEGDQRTPVGFFAPFSMMRADDT